MENRSNRSDGGHLGNCGRRGDRGSGRSYGRRGDGRRSIGSGGDSSCGSHAARCGLSERGSRGGGRGRIGGISFSGLLSAALSVAMAFGGTAAPASASAPAAAASAAALALETGAPAVFELENGSFRGSVQAGAANDKIAAHSGSGYATGFGSAGDSVSFDVDVADAGTYALNLKSALFMRNESLGKDQSFSGYGGSHQGPVTNGVADRSTYWASGIPVNEANPRWIQVDLGREMPVSMARIRVVYLWGGSRTQTFSLLGSLDNENFFTLKESATYTFASYPANATSESQRTLAGSFADVSFEAAGARYVRAVFTSPGDATGDGAQVAEFELYTPYRTAELHVDGVKFSEFRIGVQPVVDAAWDTGALEWLDAEAGNIPLAKGSHTIAIVSGGGVPGSYNLDSAEFSYYSDESDLDLDALAVTNAIAALPAVYRLMPSDARQVAEAREAFEALAEASRGRVPNLDALVGAESRLANTSFEISIANPACRDASRAAYWSARTGFQPGDSSHGDRDYILVTDVPDYLRGCDWIRSSMESRSYTATASVYEFDSAASTNLYVAWDARVDAPAWLGGAAGYEKTALSVVTFNTNGSNEYTTFNLYKKAVAAGEHVALGTMGSSRAMYMALMEHFTVEESQELADDAQSPAISDLAVGDSANAEAWSVEENLRAGDAAYGDGDSDGSGIFTRVPDSLAGSAWIRPASASALWSGAGALCSFAINRSGYLYVALPAGAAAPEWLAEYEKTPETLSVGAAEHALYRKYAYAGARAELGALAGSPGAMYIAVLKTMAVNSAPVLPTFSRFMAPFDTDGWYHMRSGLNVGSELFSNQDAAVASLPAEYAGCDYLQTYSSGSSGDKKSVYFYTERNTEISVTADSRYGAALPAWLMSWDDTGKDVAASNGRSYRIYSRTYPPDTFVTIPALSGVYDNYIVIFRPANPDGEKAANPPVPEAADPGAGQGYKYYANDVFNFDSDAAAAGYELIGGSARIVADAAGGGSGDGGAGKRADLAFRHTLAFSSAATTQYGNATDGHNSTYWEAGAGDANSWLSVNLGVARAVDTVVVAVRDYWGARAQTFSVEGSLDGSAYATLAPSRQYGFDPATGNSVTVSLPEASLAKHIRLSFTENTGAPGAQVAELQVFGPNPSGSDRFLELSRDGAYGTGGSSGAGGAYGASGTGGSSGAGGAAVLAKRFGEAIGGRAIFEFKLRSSEADQPMSAALRGPDGQSVASITFEADGYLAASDGSGLKNIMPYQPDTWYTVKLAVDLDGGAYDVWVDHLRKCQGLALPQGSAAGALAFSVEQGSSGSLFVDNVYAYDDAETYLLQDGFNGLAAGALPASGWTFTDAGAASAADVPFASDKSLMLASKNAPATAVRDIPKTVGTATVEVKVKPMGIGFSPMPVIMDDENRVAAAVAFYHNNLYACSGDNWVKALDGETPWSYYPAGNWYNIRVTLNTYTNRYDLYVDGALRMKGLSFAEDADSIGKIAFSVPANGAAYIDNLCLYEGEDFARGLYPADGAIDVRDAPYLAKGDGASNDTMAIQAALDDAEYTGAAVLLMDGTFLTSMLQVKSDTMLFVDASAKILGIQDKYDYPLLESCNSLVNHRQVGRALVYAENASNVRIEGGGTIDADGFYGYQVNDPPTGQRLQLARQSVVIAALSRDVTIQNVDLINSAFWTLVPMECTNVSIRNVNVNSMNTPNRDGIDPCDVINLTIENCSILAGDDALCFKSSSIYGCRNIDVRGVTMQSVSNGVKFGTDTYDALENLAMEDITIKNVVRSGIAIESVDGAKVDTLRFERIDMNDVDDPIFFTIGNRGRQPFDNPGTRVGYIRNVIMKDVSFFNAKSHPYSLNEDVHEAMFIGLDAAHRIQNVRLENVTLEMPGGFAEVPGWPGGTGSGYPEHSSAGGNSNAWAYCLKFCDNVTFTDCANIRLADDARPEVSYYSDYSAAPVEFDSPIRYVMPVKGLSAAAGTDLRARLPDMARVVVDYGKVVSAPVTWANAEYDPDKPGTYLFAGTVGAAAGITNPDGLAASCAVTLADTEPAFTDGDGAPLDGLSSETLVATMAYENKSGAAERLTMHVAAYSPDGKLKYVGTDAKEIAARELAIFRVRLDMPDIGAGWHASVFLWDSATLAPAAQKRSFP